MILLPITNIPNQSFSIRLKNNQYDFRIHDCRSNPAHGTGIMAVDIVRDNIAIVTGARAVAGFPLIPYRYLENGNFTFLTENDEYPTWEQFGINQYLIYASAFELEGLSGGDFGIRP